MALPSLTNPSPAVHYNVASGLTLKQLQAHPEHGGLYEDPSRLLVYGDTHGVPGVFMPIFEPCFQRKEDYENITDVFDRVAEHTANPENATIDSQGKKILQQQWQKVNHILDSLSSDQLRPLNIGSLHSLGDFMSDKRGNDAFNLTVLLKLLALHPNMTITLSNHDLSAIMFAVGGITKVNDMSDSNPSFWQEFYRPRPGRNKGHLSYFSGIQIAGLDKMKEMIQRYTKRTQLISYDETYKVLMAHALPDENKSHILFETLLGKSLFELKEEGLSLKDIVKQINIKYQEFMDEVLAGKVHSSPEGSPQRKLFKMIHSFVGDEPDKQLSRETRNHAVKTGELQPAYQAQHDILFNYTPPLTRLFPEQTNTFIHGHEFLPYFYQEVHPGARADNWVLRLTKGKEPKGLIKFVSKLSMSITAFIKDNRSGKKRILNRAGLNSVSPLVGVGEPILAPFFSMVKGHNYGLLPRMIK